MATARIRLRTRRPPSETLDLLLDPAAHTRAIPLTRVAGSMGAPGDRFLARTSLGPVGFDDPMVVTRLRRDAGGGSVEIRKQGRVVTGGTTVEVRGDDGGSVVDWVQEIGVPLLPRVLDPVVAAVARVAYTAALRRIVG